MPAEFAAPTRVVSGLGCARGALGGELRALGVTRIVVVADRGFADVGLLEPLLASTGLELPLAALIGEDPDVSEAEAAANAAREAGGEAVLAVGGGSALCAAKAAAIRLTNPPPLGAYTGVGRLPAAPAPVVAVPTTAGSGSEVSNVVVLHEPGQMRHLIIRGRGYEPHVALLDGELLRTLPRRPFVAASLDALSHALESLWVSGGNVVTDTLAVAAARRIRRALPQALETREDALLQELIEASTMANLACGNCGLGLVHALTSTPEVHLPHGYVNGVLLPHVATFNRGVVEGEAGAELDALSDLYAEIGFAARFAPGEISEADMAAMVAAALANPFGQNNRRPADAETLRAIVAAAL